MILYFLLIIAVFIYYFIYIANRNTRQISINTITPLPIEATDNSQTPPLRVLQLSDLHLEHISITPADLYNTLRNEKIDLIALTGDFLDRPKTIGKLIPYLKVLQQLNPTHGTYAVFGNHDYKLRKEPFERLKETLEKYGVTTMMNENTLVDIHGYSLQLIGIDDHHSKKHDIKKAYEGVNNQHFRLVLTHDPNIVLQMKDYDFDYLLSGHFHGGQICYPKPYHLKKFGKLVKLNLIKGLIRYEGKVFYINEGLGQTGINIRVGSRPEITIHELNISAADRYLQKVI
ncbi:putative MPP superfamily phosphohydrolase [Evansella vedderi]|uniref:MPP superfamily phosphohydrolase n=1 Tax=Evansella vedderi TaxID=38282 RepID=A0ABT9ZZX6_9BACI|nr:metallophosphoesterase [Evansella vedderi]MDQ0256791.1 putative MPP superfamily phosphohydrolase [Evansella vedderi]